MATLEAVPAGLLPFTRLKRAEEEFQLHHHHAQKKQKLMSVINYGRSHENDDDDSWEVRAFAEDTAGMGTTWPPRFYSCRFCLREFRSAQALGGHMNVHRRDRARAHLQQRPPASPVIFPVAVDSSYSSAFVSTISFAEPGSDFFSLLGKVGGNDDDAGEVLTDVEELDLDLRLGW